MDPMDRMDKDDDILSALLMTGWRVEVDLAGNIHAQRDQSHLSGLISTDGRIKWRDHSPASLGVLREARIQDIRERIKQYGNSDLS